MLQLPNGCSSSEPSIFPKNWKTKSASVKQPWRIQYYFYDPTTVPAGEKPKGKLIVVKGGVNAFRTADERREAIQFLYDELLHLLVNEGFNPLTGQKYKLPENSSGIEKYMQWVPALKAVAESVKLEKSTQRDLASCIKSIEEAAKSHSFERIPICGITRRYIKIAMETAAKVNGEVSAHKFNKLRSYLMILFKELVELEVIDGNPVRDISKRKTVIRERETLTLEERAKINDHLRSKHYSFWRFMQIFFHSGARIKEMLELRVSNVDLAGQRFKVLVKKGRQSREQWRTIKDIAVPYWIEVLTNAKPDDFVFSVGLVPGSSSIRREQITRRWNWHVKRDPKKGGLGIKADFYSLKHLNLDETAAHLDIEAAAAMAGHTTPVVTMKHYATGETLRQHLRLKKVGNEF